MLRKLCWLTGVVMASAMLFALPTFAADSLCLDITGINQVIAPSSQTKNTGLFDFELDLDDAYRACVKKSFTGEFPLEGWVWNTNLGWTSLTGAGNAAPYQNRGVNAGNYQYQSMLKVDLGDPTVGYLRGWWWNDAMGWIALSCDDVGESLGDNDYCLTESNFAVTVDYSNADALGYGVAEGYGWSDSLGWLDMTGIHFPTPADLLMDVNPEVTLWPVDDNGTILAEDADVYAAVGEGNIGYRVGIDFVDLAGNSVLADPNFDLDFRLNFFDKVGPRQAVDTGSGIDFTDYPDVGNDANQELPGKTNLLRRYNSNDFFGSSSQLYLYDVDREQLISRSVMRANAPTLDYSPANQNGVGSLLSVATVDVALRDRASGEVIGPFNKVVNREVDFLPPLTTEFSQSRPNSFNLRLGVNEPIAVAKQLVAGFDTRNFSSMRWQSIFWENPGDAQQELSQYQICLYMNSNNPTCNLEDPEINRGYARLIFTMTAGQDILARMPQQIQLFVDYITEDEEDRPAFEFAEGTGVYGLFVYRNTADRFYSYVTGRMLESDFQILEAVFKGNIQARVTNVSGSNPNLPSLGASYTSQRESYLRYADEVSRGGDISCTIEPTIDLIAKGCAISQANDASGRAVYVVDDTERNLAVAPITVPPLAQLNPNDKKEVVLVVKGRDVLINQSLYFAGADSNVVDDDSSLVIIALENGFGKGGNVYVTGDVTYLQANIFADGSLFSIGSDADYPGVAEIPLELGGTQAVKQNQLLIEGSLVSSNTIGGCDAPQPIRGDGTFVTGSGVLARAEACAYDLYYLRYSPMVYQQESGMLVWPESGPQLAWQAKRTSTNTDANAIADMRTATQARVTENSIDAGEFSVVNFIYKAPPSELPSGFTFVGR